MPMQKLIIELNCQSQDRAFGCNGIFSTRNLKRKQQEGNHVLLNTAYTLFNVPQEMKGWGCDVVTQQN